MGFKDRLMGRKPIDNKMWKQIYWKKGEALKALQDLYVPDAKGKLRKVTTVTLASGREISVSDVSEEQAHEYMKQICPTQALAESTK